MKKTLSYRLFRFGAIPKKILPILHEEGIVVSDEGIPGWFITKNVKGPGKIYLNRLRGFSGCLVITRKRVLCYTYWKRQINIAVDDPRIAGLYVDVPVDKTLSISFESSIFRDRWKGVIELRFKTGKATQFRDSLRSIGAQKGSAVNAENRHA